MFSITSFIFSRSNTIVNKILYFYKEISKVNLIIMVPVVVFLFFFIFYNNGACSSFFSQLVTNSRKFSSININNI